MTPQLRVAGPGDLDLVTALEAEVFSEDPWTPFMIAEELSSPASRYWIATDGSGDVIGYGGAKVGGDQADVITIGVRAHARGRGIGAAILVARGWSTRDFPRRAPLQRGCHRALQVAWIRRDRAQATLFPQPRRRGSRDEGAPDLRRCDDHHQIGTVGVSKFVLSDPCL